MSKHIFLMLFVMTVSTVLHSQSRGVKIGYIDMEYILQNVPDYAEAKNQLEQKAQKWKQEIEAKKIEVTRLKDALKTESVLLTKELREEREEEITFQETALLDYQQKRFGPNGDLTIQKTVLVQPIQDQVFNAAQDIAEAKKYDFIFDKTSDLTILFAAKRYDISDQVVRVITRSNKRGQQTKKQQKEEEEKIAKEEMADESPALADRQKILDGKKAAREKLIEDRKLALEEKKKENEAKRKQLIDAKKNGTAVPDSKTANKTDNGTKVDNNTNTDLTKTETGKKVIDSTDIKAKQNATAERARILAEKKQALEDKKKKALEDREAARIVKEEKAKENKKN